MINTDEAILFENGSWLYFNEPQRIIQTAILDDVTPALREIEELINKHNLHAAGFLSYEAAPAFDSALRVHSQSDFPLLWFGLYPAPRLISLPEPASTKPTLSWITATDRDRYNASIEEVKDHIAHGRTYQVNYTMRLRTDFNTDPWNFFLHLIRTQNNHSAYIDTGRFVICSVSPELFFQLDSDTITCRPMKGTSQRGRNSLEDRKQMQWLKESDKNRAENVMIVDMIRNDLGRIAKIGSVQVPELFTTEKYPTLWQMTSTVQAETSASLNGIFKALFPCASITGAPKVSTMKIISELETTPRRIYTGSIGYIAPNRKAIFNVAIRTAVIDSETQTAEYGIGGGIVWDSNNKDEYAEALLKARLLIEDRPQFSLFETVLWSPEDGFFLKEKHIARLVDSAEYFDFSISKETIETYLDEISPQFTSSQRVRLLLDKNGNISHEAKPFQLSDSPSLLKVCPAKEPVNSGNVFLFHKTTHRDVYDSARKDFPNHDDVLLYNEHGEVTEFTIGNIIVEMGEKLYTPPISCGVLAGTFRAHLLETGQVEERVIHIDELKKITKFFFVNSVRKWREVEMAKIGEV